MVAMVAGCWTGSSQPVEKPPDGPCRRGRGASAERTADLARDLVCRRRGVPRCEEARQPAGDSRASRSSSARASQSPAARRTSQRRSCPVGASSSRRRRAIRQKDHPDLRRPESRPAQAQAQADAVVQVRREARAANDRRACMAGRRCRRAYDVGKLASLAALPKPANEEDDGEHGDDVADDLSGVGITRNPSLPLPPPSSRNRDLIGGS